MPLSFPRYSKDTINAVRFAKSRGVEIVAITDQEQSPWRRCRRRRSGAQRDAVFYRLHDGPLSLINALLVGIATKMGTDVTETFSTLESLWDQYGVFGGADDE